MKKKVEFESFMGFFLLIIGGLSITISIISIILNILLIQTGFFLYVKDILFELVFILLGLILIRKKKIKKFQSI